ncbi:MAG: hypothetical protein ABIG68_08180 [Acidobacteriota bacterium]
MAKFAVYYVPPAEDELYRLGTSVLGYDVRKGKDVPTILEDPETSPGFPEAWIGKARHYGFHLTIGDAIDFHLFDILTIEQEIKDLLNCFNPDHKFTLTRREHDFVSFRGPAVVLGYEANDHLKILHAVIATRIHLLGTGSGYFERHLSDPSKGAGRPHRLHRTRKFFSPTILDSYFPHFTVLRAYPGKANDPQVTRFFCDQFQTFSKIEVGSICLLLQMNEGENWRIHKEFKRESFPESFPS